MHVRRELPRWAFVVLATAICTSLGSAGTPQPAAGDRWTLATDDTVLTIGRVGEGGVAILELKNPQQQHNWIQSPCPIPLLSRGDCDGKSLSPDWTLQDAAVDTSDGTKLTLKFTSPAPKLEITSQWWARPGAGPVRHASFITNRGGSNVAIGYQPTLSLQLTAPQTGTFQVWHFASDGGAGGIDPRGVYQEQVTPSFSQTLRTDPWAEAKLGNTAIPLAVFDSGGRHGLYVGTEWSYGDIKITGSASTPLGAIVQTGNVTDFQTTLGAGQVFQVPPGFVGAYQGDIDDAGNRLRKYLFNYNTPAVLRNDATYPKVQWNAFGATGKAPGSWDSVQSKYYPLVAAAAELGFEEIMLDTGWWTGNEPNADPLDWPSGMKAAADHAHQRGLRFGLYWPDAGDMATVAGQQLRAKNIRALYHNYGADLWRSDSTAGMVLVPNYSAVKGFYDMLDGLYQTLPGFQWENCSCGGRIKDYGAMKRSVKIFNSDNFWPLDVRRAFYDSSFAFHPMQLEGHLGSSAGDYRPSNGGPECLKYGFRSMSMGAPQWFIDAPNGGNGSAPWTKEEQGAIKTAVATYKTKIRPLVRSADLYHIFPRPNDIVWDGLEYYDPATRKGVVFIFKPNSPHDTQTVKLRGLDARRTYRLKFEDGSNPPIDKVGADLLGVGFDVKLTGKFVSELILFEAVDGVRQE